MDEIRLEGSLALNNWQREEVRELESIWNQVNAELEKHRPNFANPKPSHSDLQRVKMSLYIIDRLDEEFHSLRCMSGEMGLFEPLPSWIQRLRGKFTADRYFLENHQKTIHGLIKDRQLLRENWLFKIAVCLAIVTILNVAFACWDIWLRLHSSEIIKVQLVESTD